MKHRVGKLAPSPGDKRWGSIEYTPTFTCAYYAVCWMIMPHSTYIATTEILLWQLSAHMSDRDVNDCFLLEG